MAGSEAFYSDTSPWTPPKNAYPTWDHLMRFYMSRVYSTSSGGSDGAATPRCINTSPDQVIHDLAVFCVMVWESGDGCPKGVQAVKAQFKTQIFPLYQKYRKGDIQDEAFKTKKKKKKKKDADAPTQSVKTRGASGPSRYSAWQRDYGHKLFDIFSIAHMHLQLAEGKAFDCDFYEDQKDCEKRFLVIETMRVRKEFFEQENKLNLLKARKYARKMSALGLATSSGHAQSEDEDDDEDEMPGSPFKDQNIASTPSSTSQHLSALTRSTVVRHLHHQLDNVITVPATINTLFDQSSQTEEIFLEDIKDCNMPKISTRKKVSRKVSTSKKSTLVSPAYLLS